MNDRYQDQRSALHVALLASIEVQQADLHTAAGYSLVWRPRLSAYCFTDSANACSPNSPPIQIRDEVCKYLQIQLQRMRSHLFIRSGTTGADRTEALESVTEVYYLFGEVDLVGLSENVS